MADKIYLAGPEVFLADARTILAAKAKICREYGFEGVTPLDSEIAVDETDPWQGGLAISEANEQLLTQCDLLIANATPVRGPNMDVGTAFEIGFMKARGKPVLAYTNVLDLFVERMVNNAGGPRLGPSGGLLDQDGLRIEEHGFVENLMIDGAVITSLGRIVRHRAAPGEWFTDLTGFRECVKMAVELTPQWKAAGGT